MCGCHSTLAAFCPGNGTGRAAGYPGEGGGSPVRMRELATRSVRLLAVLFLVAGVAGGVAPFAAATVRTGSPGPAASFSTSGELSGVAATSATNAWAIGATGTGQTLIVHWNGKTWTRVPSPGGAFHGVAATS